MGSQWVWYHSSQNKSETNLSLPVFLPHNRFVVIQSLSCVCVVTSWTAAFQASLVLCHLPELTQTHIHWVGDAIQPYCPLLLPSFPAFNFPRIRVFSNESVPLIRWPKCWSFSFSISPSNEYTRLISFRMDWFASPCSSRDCQESSPTPQFKSINSSVLSFLYSPTLTSIHDYRKNHSLD